jgi:hypothetical protein
MSNNRRKYVRTRTWDTVSKPDFFPERDDPEVGISELDKKDDLGLCFSGGGTRSASATLGQLRGLRSIGLLVRARYICAVSGGSWAATPFVYLPERFDDDGFLCSRLEPEQITDAELENTPDGSLAKAISETVIGDDFLGSVFKLRGDECYSRAVGDLFLEPFGLDDNKKFFTWNARSLRAVLKNNGREQDAECYLQPEDFYLARDGRPFLIVGATLLYGNKDAYEIAPMEITPLYLGARQHLRGKGKGGADIGGCYLESFAYDSKYNDEDIGATPFRVKFWSMNPRGHRYFFNLSDMIGTSGAAPVRELYKRGMTDCGFPEFRHWSIHSLDKGHAEYSHGDGGHADNLGIMPMLARGVRKIIVFVNSSKAFQPVSNDEDERYDSRLAPLFGFAGMPKPGDLPTTSPSSENHVFDRNGLKELLDSLQKCQDRGETLLHMGTYEVKANLRFGIRPYSGVKIVWIYNGDVPKWRNGLPQHVREDLREKKDAFKRFPNYLTFGEEKGHLIDLTRAKVNALAHLSCWNITENSVKIREFFGL